MAAITTLTSSNASVGIKGIVNFLLRDRSSGRRHQRERTRLIAVPHRLLQMPEQGFLFARRQLSDGFLNFDNRAHVFNP